MKSINKIPVKVTLNPDFPISAYSTYTQGDSPITHIHTHENLELGYCYEGTGIFIVEQKMFSFKAGDISVVSSREGHLAKSAKGSKSTWTFINLDPLKLVQSGADNMPLLNPDTMLGPNFKNIISPENDPSLPILVKEIFEELKNKNKHYKSIIKSLVWNLMVKLKRLYPDAQLKNENKSLALEKITPVLNYMASHYSEEITLPAMSKLCHMSTSNVRRYFQKATDKSPQEYLMELRIQMACGLLASGSKSILDVASDLGYPTGNFQDSCRLYRISIGHS